MVGENFGFDFVVVFVVDVNDSRELVWKDCVVFFVVVEVNFCGEFEVVWVVDVCIVEVIEEDVEFVVFIE